MESIRYKPVGVLIVSLILVSTLSFGQTPQRQTGSPDFNVGAPKDDVMAHGKHAAPVHTGKSREDSPDRTVGPQRDGSIVASDNLSLKPAGRIIEFGVSVRAKSEPLD